jgi:hypothetical protein
VKLFAGFANGEAAMDVKNGDGAAGANVYFHGGVIGHVVILRPVDNRRWLERVSNRVHYTTKEDDMRLVGGICAGNLDGRPSVGFSAPIAKARASGWFKSRSISGSPTLTFQI